MRCVIPAALGALSLWAGPASAQQFTPPPGCTGVVTIQHRGCLMTNVWQCEAEPEGIQFVGMFGEDGLRRVRRVNAEYQWLETYVLTTQTDEWFVEDPADAPSLQTLVSEGRDEFDFLIGRSTGALLRYVGFDALTGNAITLNGFELLELDYELTITRFDETGLVESHVGDGSGVQYVSPELSIFVFGQFYNYPEPGQVTNYTPVEMIRPGEPGFFAGQPRHDCEPVLSDFDAVHDEPRLIETGALQ